ncbi:phage holin [Lentibacillus sp. Marseille-P4043]|uniref:phage holin n=1 Tax=Lentibacillus sp. Marseille-P4043 TaxID=2040293 RepID=UPI002D79E871|nr:phage holin [Lentibacillus sp. Marseille-P4043]
MFDLDKGTLIRTVVLIVALINQFLVTAGLNPIPGSQETWGEVLTMIITAAVSVWTWFRNNYITATGKKQKEVLERNNLTK